MTQFLLSFLVVNTLIVIITYWAMYRKRKAFSANHAAMLVRCSSIFSLNIGMIIQFLFPDQTTLISILGAIIGGSMGVLLGFLLKFRLTSIGFFHGIVGGIMGTMLGAVILNPAICSLPTDNLHIIAQNTVVFSLFGTTLIVITAGLLLKKNDHQKILKVCSR